MSEKCPKCGGATIDRDRGVITFECLSTQYPTRFEQSDDCLISQLRDQLAQQQEENERLESVVDNLPKYADTGEPMMPRASAWAVMGEPPLVYGGYVGGYDYTTPEACHGQAPETYFACTSGMWCEAVPKIYSTPEAAEAALLATAE